MQPRSPLRFDEIKQSDQSHKARKWGAGLDLETKAWSLSEEGGCGTMDRHLPQPGPIPVLLEE